MIKNNFRHPISYRLERNVQANIEIKTEIE
jgi:hypothetical protein